MPLNITTYAQMTAHLKAEAAKSPLVRVVSLGKSAGGQRELWLVRLADPAADVEHTTRLLVLCRQHGDEPASTEALLRLIQSITSGGDPALRSALSHATLYIVPMVNPDGAGAGTRSSRTGADLNRDWGIFKQPETRAVARAVTLIHPALIVDAHNWDGNDEYNADCIEIPREMETKPGRAAHAMQQQAVRDLTACGYRVHSTAWGEDTDPHLAHRWFTHQNITSLLVETHYGSPANRADFERREGMYTALVHSLVRHYDAPWAWQASHATREAALFPLPATPGVAGRIASSPLHTFRWLWAFGLYGLALWGMSLREKEREERGNKFLSLDRVVLRTKYRRTKESGQEDGPRMASFVRRTTPSSERNLFPRFSCPRYSYSRNRDKAATISRSGHRKAVGLPPR